MSTQALEQDQDKLKSAEQTRAGEFAGEERQRSIEAAMAVTVSTGETKATGTAIYHVHLWDDKGFVQLYGWAEGGTDMTSIVAAEGDWIGIFYNRTLAVNNPEGNCIKGNTFDGMLMVSTILGNNPHPITIDVPLQHEMVAAYVIRAYQGNYVTVAVTPPYKR